MKMALIVIDMQKYFLAEFLNTRAIKDCCEYINYVGDLLRNSGHLVIHVKDIEEASNVSATELDYIDAIKIDPSDLHVEKVYSNAFWETDLENIVQKHNIDLLILCGQAAEHCVVFTYGGAQERGHKAVILQNGVFSQVPGRVAALMEDRNTISHPVIEMAITAGQRRV